MDGRTARRRSSGGARLGPRLFGARRSRTSVPVWVRVPPPSAIPPVVDPDRFGCRPDPFPLKFRVRHMAGACLTAVGAATWFYSGLAGAALAVTGGLLVVSAPGARTWEQTEAARVQLDARAELLRRRAEFSRVFKTCVDGPPAGDRATLDTLLEAQAQLKLHDVEIDEYELAILETLKARVAGARVGSMEAPAVVGPASVRRTDGAALPRV